ncbi:MAG: mercuric ion transport protein [Halioglobus sp.]|jgi:mercuric ion transport protein
MQNKRLFRVGTIGAVIAAVCCFTNLLVILLAAVGLSSLLGVLDFVLFPALAFFIGLMLFAYFKTSESQPPPS